MFALHIPEGPSDPTERREPIFGSVEVLPQEIDRLQEWLCSHERSILLIIRCAEVLLYYASAQV
jgi:hypothetical protein